jgi:uncharacterized protein YycO
MTARLFHATLSILLLVIGCAAWPGASGAADLAELAPLLRDGDIIFQESRSSQAAALKAATGSRYTHVGLMESRDDGWWVLEAVSPVKRTPLADWVARGADGHAVIKRVEASMEPAQLDAVLTTAAGWLGRPYDLPFLWSDDALYCSELVWKAYERGAGLELAPLRRHGDYQLASPEVQAKIRERYPAGIPTDEPVVAPSDLFDAAGLRTVGVVE